MSKASKPVHPSKAHKQQSVQGRVEQAEDIHRTPPNSSQAEQGVLCSILISPMEAIPECMERIQPECFYHPVHQLLYENLLELWNARIPIELITFTQILRDKNILESVGGAAFITDLHTFVPTAANVAYYLEIVRDKHILRQVISASTESVRRAYEDQDEVNTLLDDVERKILSIRPMQASRMRSTADLVSSGIESLEFVYENKGAITGLPTGFHDLDRMTNGLQNQEMIVIAARPSMGKTALAMNIAEKVAVDQGLPVLVFSLEMSADQIMQRLLCSRARVNLQKVRDGFMRESDFPKLVSAGVAIRNSKLDIDDEKLFVDVLVSRARRHKMEKGTRLIVVDYIQLLKARGFKVSERQAEVSYISSALKGIAKDLGIPVIVCAQLNRQPETRHGGKPRLSDLRESGSIEQDADLVGLLTRGEVYEEEEEAKAEKAGEAELIVAKQRNGPVGQIDLTFLKEFTRFEDRARAGRQPEQGKLIDTDGIHE